MDSKSCFEYLWLREVVLGAVGDGVHLCLWMRALKAMPSLQLVLKLWMLTFGYLPEQNRVEENFQNNTMAF